MDKQDKRSNEGITYMYVRIREKERNRQTDRHTYRERKKEIDRQTYKERECMYVCMCVNQPKNLIKKANLVKEPYGYNQRYYTSEFII